MKKKIVTTIVSAMVCASMLGTTCFAATPGEMDTALTDTDISGENTVQPTIFKLTVPTDLAFAVDAFEQEGKSQIASADFTVTNMSNIPVVVDVTFKAEKGTGTNTPVFVADPDKVTADSAFTVYMEASVAKTAVESKGAKKAFTPAIKKATLNTETIYHLGSLTVNAATGSAAFDELEELESIAVTYPDTTANPAEKEVLYPISGVDGSKITFALDKAEYIHYISAVDSSNDPTTYSDIFKTTAASDAGTAAYKIQGKVNPNVIWAAKDIKVTATYNFNGLSGDQYTKYVADYAVAGAQGLVEIPEAPTFTASTTTKGTFSYTVGSGSDAVASIDKVEMVNDGGTPFDGFNALDGAWAAATVANGTVTLDSQFINFFKADTVATITYTTKGGTTKTATVTIKCV